MENKSAYPIILDIERLINEHLRFIECFNQYEDYYYFVGMSMELEDLNPIRLIESLTNAKDIEKLLPRLLNEENLSVIEKIRNYTRPAKKHLMNDLSFISKLPSLMSLKKDYEKNGNIPKEILDEPCIMKDWYNALFEDRIVKLFDKLRDYYNSISDHEITPAIVEAKEPPHMEKVEKKDNSQNKRFPCFHKDNEIGKSKLIFLHSELVKNKLIANNTDLKSLYYWFGCIDTEHPKIKWTGSIVELVCFIHELYGNKWTIAANCFIDEEGNSISSSSMKVTFSKGYEANDKNKVSKIINLVNTFKTNKPLS